MSEQVEERLFISNTMSSIAQGMTGASEQERHIAERIANKYRAVDEEQEFERGHLLEVCSILREELARERESRKQAEDKAFNAGIEAAAKAAGSVYEEHLKRNPLVTQLSTPQSVLDAAVRLVRALSKPIPQEPAEPESGK